VAGPRSQLSAVTAGRADLVDLVANSQPSRGLGLRYPTRLHSSLRTGTTYVFLNTRQPPFNNVQVRPAVNYAIDRAHLASLFGLAPGEAAVTCQILPVDFPGHQPYCPYTTGDNNGTWRGPDIRKARRLVNASHTTDVPVTVWGYPRDAGMGAYLVRLLPGLGYRAKPGSRPVRGQRAVLPVHTTDRPAVPAVRPRSQQGVIARGPQQTVAPLPRSGGQKNTKVAGLVHRGGSGHGDVPGARLCHCASTDAAEDDRGGVGTEQPPRAGLCGEAARAPATRSRTRYGRHAAIPACCGCSPGLPCSSARPPGSCGTSWWSTRGNAGASSTSSTAG